MPFTVTQHDDVCSPTFDAQGSCARGVIGVVGDLLFAQLLSSAFVSTAIALVMETSTAKHAKSTAMSTLRRSMQRGSRAEEDEDTEEVTELDLDVAEGEIIMYVAPRQPHNHASHLWRAGASKSCSCSASFIHKSSRWRVLSSTSTIASIMWR